MSSFTKRQLLDGNQFNGADNASECWGLRIATTSDASPVELFAAEELQRLASAVFKSVPTGRPDFVLGVPEVNSLIASIFAARDLQPLQEQEYVILPHEIEGRSVLVLAGGSPAAVLWAVYELAEFWGVTYLTDRESLPAVPPTQIVPPEPVRRSPWMPLRAWRGFNQLPHSGAYWGLEDYQKLIDQLAKMRFNCFFIADGPNTPLVDFHWANTPKSTAALSFGWRYPIDDVTIGREKFAGAKWFENPDVPYEADYDEKVSATKRLIQGVMEHAKSRGMKTGLSIRFTEFPDEFKDTLHKVSKEDSFNVSANTNAGYVYRLGVAREGADPDVYGYMTVRNPHYVDLIQAQLEAYLEQCGNCDYYMFWPPEFNNADSDAEFAWQSLSERYPLGDIAKFESLVEKIVEDQATAKNAMPAERLRLQCYNLVCSVYLLDELLTHRGLTSKYGLSNRQFVFYLPSPSLGELASLVLGEDAGYMVGLGNAYHASSATKHVHQIDECEVMPRSLHMTLALEDDNIGLTPQFTAPSIDHMLKTLRRHQVCGVWCRQWLLNKIEPTIYYVSHVCWNRSLTPQQAYKSLTQRLCGDAAAVVFEKASILGEQITIANDEALNIHSFLVPKLLAKFWEDGAELGTGMTATIPKYQQFERLLEQAWNVSSSHGRFFIERHLDQCRFAAHWVATMQKLTDAARANQSAQDARGLGDVTRMDTSLQASVDLLDEAIEEAIAALNAWSRAVGDRADLGALAALNEYGLRYLVSIRHVQFIRSQHWDCQINPSND